MCVIRDRLTDQPTAEIICEIVQKREVGQKRKANKTITNTNPNTSQANTQETQKQAHTNNKKQHKQADPSGFSTQCLQRDIPQRGQARKQTSTQQKN